jgi:serine/threonine protein kinase
MSSAFKIVGDYQLQTHLGTGSFGLVKCNFLPFLTLILSLVGTHMKSKKCYACKIMKKDEIKGNPSLIEKVKKEFMILSQLEHPSIVKLEDKVETKSELMFVMELAQGGDLFEYILKHGSVSL